MGRHFKWHSLIVLICASAFSRNSERVKMLLFTGKYWILSVSLGLKLLFLFFLNDSADVAVGWPS